MKNQYVLAVATELIERGWTSDFLVRWGIRHLCSQRLKEESALMRDMGLTRTRAQFIERLRNTDIAPVASMANEQHYEVPTEFFRLILGPQLKYSSGWWGDGVRCLKDAEEAALRLSASYARVSDGMKILDLGCGWGSLTLWLARQYPRCQITALSNSVKQRLWIESQARARGLMNVTVITANINNFQASERFDRIVSVEMFEHMRNYHVLLSRIHEWLTPQGSLYVHLFCHQTFSYLFEETGADNWMGRNFFTGGLMPSADLLPLIPSPFRVEEQVRWSGAHYRQTSEAWLRNLDDRRGEVSSVFEKKYGQHLTSRWLERWRVFFMACSELFGYRAGTEWGVTHYRLVPKDNFVSD